MAENENPTSAPAPISLEAPPAGGGGGSVPDAARDDGLEPLDLVFIPEPLRKHVDPSSPPPVRLMGARAMLPGAKPRDMVHVVYQAMLDPEPKIAAMAKSTFEGFDDRILNAVLSDALAPPVLDRFARIHIKSKERLEKILLNKATPDSAFVYVGRHAEDQAIIGMVAGNQARLLRCHDICRAIAENPKALRSELDRAIDFLVREGVFLDDVDAFEDAFLRLGKAEMLDAIKKVKVGTAQLTEEERRIVEEHGADPEDVLAGNHEAVQALLDAGGEQQTGKRTPLNRLRIPEQIKLAMVGDHARAMEALQSTNRLVAAAGIRNPRITENDVQRIVKSRGMHEEVIRYICSNNDWTKSYGVKLSLIQNPKTPPTLVMRWMPLLRQNDLRSLAKSKQVPSNVSAQAKRLLAQKNAK